MAKYKIVHLIKPFERFAQNSSTGGILLFIAALAAIIWANSPWAASYHELWRNPVGLTFGEYKIVKSLHDVINDGLMALFFFVVGLELKREIIGGELSSIRKALLPIGAAVGGMVVPACIFLLFNWQGEGQDGWGIPMATDIAFALGVISLLGKKVPLAVKVFLTALAITDDLGAVLVIAFFYTSEIYFSNLMWGLAFMVVLVAANYLGVRKSLFYGFVGICGVWLAFLMSGVHATIAGVLAAMTIPARTVIDENKFVKSLEARIHQFRKIPPNDVTLLEPRQYEVIDTINRLTEEASTPLQRLEHNLHPWVAFLVMPLFAFANAGIELSSEVLDTFFKGVSMGVAAGLAIGKFVGVVGVSALMIVFRIADFPAGMSVRHLLGVGFVAGIGFTMSLFITGLAFRDESLTTEAKVGIFAASILSGIVGYIVLNKKTE